MSEKRKLFIRKDGTYYEPVGLNESDVQGIIEADKDIISKLVPVYNSETGQTNITFPPKVLPFRMYSEQFEHIGGSSEIYFDYSNQNIVTDNHVTVGSMSFEEINDEQCVVIFFNEEITTLESVDLTYCYFNSVEDILDSYYLYHPQTETKLYYHEISLFGDTAVADLITTRSTPYTSINEITNAIIKSCKAYYYSRDYGSGPLSNMDIENTGEDELVITYFDYGEGAEMDERGNVTSFTDTVTEL